MDRLAVIQGQKLRLDFPVDKMVETMDRQAVIQALKLFKQRLDF